MKLRVLLSSFLLASLAFGQSEVGGATLNGTVTDPSGAAVSGAKVTALSLETGFKRETETSAVGLYNLVRLPVGTYDLTVEITGFRAAKRTGIRLSVGALTTLDVKLELGSTQESVTVTSEVPLVESTRSQTSSTVNQRAVSDLPVNGRNFLDFALLTPGVNRDPRFGDISFGGQRGTANSLLVDGGDSNNLFFGQSSGRAGAGRNPYSFSQDAVQEFQVNTNGYAAEIGRAGGGVINVITKSGTNQLHGTGFWFFRDKAMNANTFINNSRNIVKQPYHFNQYGGNIGGPIKRDKLFFFFDYDGQRNKNPNAVFLTIPAPADAVSQRAARELDPFLASYTRNFDNNIYTGKVDWIVGVNQNLSVRYNAHRFQGVNLENAGSASAREHTGNSNVTTDNLAATYTHVLRPTLLWDARFIYLRDNEPGEANSTAPEAVIRQGGTTVMQIGRNFFSPRYTNTKRIQTIQSLSYTRGRHTYKMGFDLNLERIDNFFPGNFSGSYTFNSYADFATRTPFSYTQAFGGAGTSGALTQPHVNEYAFFVQDSWRVNDRLTLNYGARYDLMNSADPLVDNPDPGLKAAGLSTSRMNLDTNNWAGRFGFARKMDSEGRLVVRGGYGIFYGRTPGILTGTAHSQNGIQVRTFTLRAGFPTYPNILMAPPSGTVRPDIYIYAPDYVQPQTHQWNFNVEKSLGRDYSVTLGYLGVRGIHLTRTRDINLYPSELVQGRFSDGTPVSFYRHPGAAAPDRPNAAFGRISLFDSGADSIYHGGFVQLNKRFAQNFQVMASYTYAKVMDSAPEQTSVVVGGSDDAKVAQDTLQPNLDRGPGDADLRHRVVLSGVWDLVYGRSLSNAAARALLRDYQISLITTLETSRYSSALVSADVNNDGNTRIDRPPYLGRNTIAGPGFASVDVRASRDIKLKERATLRLIVEGFNVTNRANFNNFNRGQYTFNATTRVFTPTTNFLQRTGSADPRILQIAAKFIF